MTVNGALWTLAIEFQYYLLLPFVAPLFVRWPWRSLFAAAAIAAGWRWLAWNELDFLVAVFLKLGAKAGVSEKEIRHLIETQLPAWSLHFALGILAGRAWMLRRRERPSGVSAWIPVVIAGGALLGLYAVFRNGTSILGAMGWIVFPLLIAIAFAAVVSWPSPLLSRVVASAPLAGWGGSAIRRTSTTCRCCSCSTPTCRGRMRSSRSWFGWRLFWGFRRLRTASWRCPISRGRAKRRRSRIGP